MRPGRFRPLLIAGVVFLASCSASNAGSDNDVQQGAESSTVSTVEDAESRSDQTSATRDQQDNAEALSVGRADLTPEGNRVIEGRGVLTTAEPIDIAVGATPLWVFPITDADGNDDADSDKGQWLVVLDSGETVVIGQDGSVTGGAPYVTPSALDRFTDPLPDGRVVSSGGVEVALVGPTDRYPHGVLGDRIEASAIEVRSTEDGSLVSFGPDEPTVIEGISPMLGDVDLDGTPEILVTQSNADVGAWLALWSLDGELIAQSDPIGQGNRWRNQLAIAPVGPDGEIEIIDVRTPHLGGTVEYFRLDGARLERIATQTGYTSHQIGSRNLDLGIVADATGDGMLNVVVPTNDRQMLGILRRTEDGVVVEANVDLPGRLTTNVSAMESGDGQLWFAVGTNEQLVRIWPAS